MDRKADMLRGAELMTQAFFDSATSKDGMSFGAVVDRFCELSGIDRSTYGVLCVLHHAGGLTVNNAIGDDYRGQKKGCKWDTDGDGNCGFHRNGCPQINS
jgi:hypothetical protein